MEYKQCIRCKQIFRETMINRGVCDDCNIEELGELMRQKFDTIGATTTRAEMKKTSVRAAWFDEVYQIYSDWKSRTSVE